jgi:hypothetical protein
MYAQNGVYQMDSSKAAPGSTPGIPMNSAGRLPVTQAKDVGNLGKIPGMPTPADKNMLLTTRLNGCTYCFQPSADGKSMTTAHLQPGSGKNAGADLAKSVNQNGAFDGLPNKAGFKAYGRLDGSAPAGSYGYGDGNSHILAMKNQKDQWEVYNQLTRPDGSLGVSRLN